MPEPTRLTLPPSDDDLLVIEEVAAILGYSVQGLHQSRHRGLAPGSLAVKYRNRLFWRASDIEKWLAERFDDDFDRRWSERHRKRGQPIKTHAKQLLDEKKKAEREARNAS